MFFFFFNDTATTEIYPLSLHDALPISASFARISGVPRVPISPAVKSRIPVLYPRCAIFSSVPPQVSSASSGRSEEHTSELQSRLHLVCRLLLEKKKNMCTAHTQLTITP